MSFWRPFFLLLPECRLTFSSFRFYLILSCHCHTALFQKTETLCSECTCQNNNQIGIMQLTRKRTCTSQTRVNNTSDTRPKTQYVYSQQRKHTCPISEDQYMGMSRFMLGCHSQQKGLAGTPASCNNGRYAVAGRVYSRLPTTNTWLVNDKILQVSA